MDLPSAAVGIGGLFVAALSLLLTYKSRSAAHRELLYTKQVEAYSAVIDALLVLEKDSMSFISEHGNRPNWDNQTLQEFRDTFRKVYYNAVDTVSKQSLFL